MTKRSRAALPLLLVPLALAAGCRSPEAPRPDARPPAGVAVSESGLERVWIETLGLE